MQVEFEHWQHSRILGLGKEETSGHVALPVDEERHQDTQSSGSRHEEVEWEPEHGGEARVPISPLAYVLFEKTQVRQADRRCNIHEK